MFRCMWLSVHDAMLGANIFTPFVAVVAALSLNMYIALVEEFEP